MQRKFDNRWSTLWYWSRETFKIFPLFPIRCMCAIVQRTSRTEHQYSLCCIHTSVSQSMWSLQGSQYGNRSLKSVPAHVLERKLFSLVVFEMTLEKRMALLQAIQWWTFRIQNRPQCGSILVIYHVMLLTPASHVSEIFKTLIKEAYVTLACNATFLGYNVMTSFRTPVTLSSDFTQQESFQLIASVDIPVECHAFQDY